MSGLYPQFQQSVNPMVANQQARLSQMEQMYPQFSQQYQQPFYQQVQPQQQPIQANVLNGRMVNNEAEVKFNEVPQDGSSAVFIKSDLSEIYLKKLDSKGNVDTDVYSLRPKSNFIQKSDNPIEKKIDDLSQKVENLDEKLNQVLSPAPSVQKQKMVKKGGDSK